MSWLQLLTNILVMFGCMVLAYRRGLREGFDDGVATHKKCQEQMLGEDWRARLVQHDENCVLRHTKVNPEIREQRAKLDEHEVQLLEEHPEQLRRVEPSGAPAIAVEPPPSMSLTYVRSLDDKVVSSERPVVLRRAMKVT